MWRVVVFAGFICLCEGQGLCGDKVCYEKCIDNACVCPDDKPIGNPYFKCYPESDYHCEITNDPGIKTFRGEFALVSYPCSYLITDVSTALANATQNELCKVQIFGFNLKHLGKFYVASFQIYISVTTEMVSFFLCIRVLSIVRGNRKPDYVIEHKFSSNESDPFIPGPPLGATLPDGRPVTVETDRADFINLAVPGCGIFSSFRRYDPQTRYTVIPGLSVYVEPDFDPTWFSPSKTLCLPPAPVQPDLQKLADTLGTSVEYSLWFQAMLADVPQAPEVSNRFVGIRNVLTRCDRVDRDNALKLVRFVYYNALFANCYDDSINAEDLLFLQERFVLSVCDKSSSLCLKAQDDVRNSTCSDLADPDFLGFDCSSLD